MKMLKNRTRALLTSTIIAALIGVTPLGGLAQGQTQGLTGARDVLVKVLNLSNSGKLATKPAMAMLSGVAKGWELKSLGTLQPQPDKIMAIDANHAVGRTQWLGKDGQTTDYYFYLVKEIDDQWKVEDCRSLASIGVAWEARKKLKAKKKLNAEQIYQINNMNLLLSSDAQLNAWFKTNKGKLDALYRMAKAMPKPYPAMIRAADKRYGAIASAIAALNLDSISMAETGELQVILGGFDRDFVGLLYSERKGKLPPVSPRAWLWVEDLSGNWYLFRHT